MATYSPKLSSATKRLLVQVPANTNPQLSLLLRVDGGLDADRRLPLERLGVTVRSIAGDVVTVTAPLAVLPALAALEFIVSIEASSPLYPEVKLQSNDS